MDDVVLLILIDAVVCPVARGLLFPALLAAGLELAARAVEAHVVDVLVLERLQLDRTIVHRDASLEDVLALGGLRPRPRRCHR